MWYLSNSYTLCSGVSPVHTGCVVLARNLVFGCTCTPFQVFCVYRMSEMTKQYLTTKYAYFVSLCIVQGHYNDIIMSAMASQITSLTIIYSTVYSGADQRKHQSFASLAFVRGIHRGTVNSPHKGPVTRKTFPFDDVIMDNACFRCLVSVLLMHSLCLSKPRSSIRTTMKNYGKLPTGTYRKAKYKRYTDWKHSPLSQYQ